MIVECIWPGPIYDTTLLDIKTAAETMFGVPCIVRQILSDPTKFEIEPHQGKPGTPIFLVAEAKTQANQAKVKRLLHG